MVIRGVDRVVMFSGGLELVRTQAIELASSGENLVLVSHRPYSVLSARQKKLYKRLKDRFHSVRMLHLPVWINKIGLPREEPTQRTRSFLFAAIGAVVARTIGAKGVRFYENGIISLNLPVADEVLSARASRTTHPLALGMLSTLLSTVTDVDLEVDNPLRI